MHVPRILVQMQNLTQQIFQLREAVYLTSSQVVLTLQVLVWGLLSEKKSYGSVILNYGTFQFL